MRIDVFVFPSREKNRHFKHVAHLQSCTYLKRVVEVFHAKETEKHRLSHISATFRLIFDSTGTDVA